MGNGTRIRRNRRHLRTTKEDFQLKDEDQWDSDCEVQPAKSQNLQHDRHTDFENRPETDEQETVYYRTRSGRQVKPPDRYGDWDYG